jgi:hypothetical protein
VAFVEGGPQIASGSGILASGVLYSFYHMKKLLYKKLTEMSQRYFLAAVVLNIVTLPSPPPPYPGKKERYSLLNPQIIQS